MLTKLPDGVRLLRTLNDQGRKIGRIAWSPDGHLLATSSVDGAVRIWNTQSGEFLRTIRIQRQGVSELAFDPDGRILATGGDDTSLWDVDSGKLRNQLIRGTCRAVALSSCSQILASTNGSDVVTL